MHFDHLPATIQLSHLAYEPKSIVIKKGMDLVIRLAPISYPLDTITVKSDPVISILEDKPLYVWDYEFYDDMLIFLAYQDMSMFKPRLILFNTEGDSIASMPVRKAQRLFKDCTDEVHLIKRDEVSQVYFDSTNLHLIYTYPADMVDSILNPCIEKLGQNFYFHQYYYRNQVLLYYYFNQVSKETTELTFIKDSLRMLHAFDEDRFASMGSYDEFDKRFVEMVIYAPLYAPLRKIDNIIYVFDFTNDLLMQFDSSGNVSRSVELTFHHKDDWNKSILIDEKKGKVYSVFLNNGNYHLREIDLKLGIAGIPIIIPNYPFIEKIKIRNGYVYFLYKEKKHYQYKKLFKMQLR